MPWKCHRGNGCTPGGSSECANGSNLYQRTVRNHSRAPEHHIAPGGSGELARRTKVNMKDCSWANPEQAPLCTQRDQARVVEYNRRLLLNAVDLEPSRCDSATMDCFSSKMPLLARCLSASSHAVLERGAVRNPRFWGDLPENCHTCPGVKVGPDVWCVGNAEAEIARGQHSTARGSAQKHAGRQFSAWGRLVPTRRACVPVCRGLLCGEWRGVPQIHHSADRWDAGDIARGGTETREVRVDSPRHAAADGWQQIVRQLAPMLERVKRKSV